MLLIVSFSAFTYSSEGLSMLTTSEAQALVEAEMRAKAEREQARRKALEAVPALHESEVRIGGRTVIFRRIRSGEDPARLAGATVPENNRRSSIISDAEAIPVIRMIPLSVSIHNREVSQITWRGDNGEAYTVLSNVDFNYLRSVGTFTHDGVHWSFNASMENVGSTLDRGVFTSDEPEYVVYVPEGAAVPETLREELDALHYHYLENEAALKTLYYRNEALNQARLEYPEKNPPGPKDTVINFWPVRSKPGTAETR